MESLPSEMSETRSTTQQMLRGGIKPLPRLKTAPEADLFGFTEKEKRALKNLLRVVKRHYRHHAVVVHTNFFTTNDALLGNFRKDGKFNLQALNRHPFSVMKTFDQIITDGFDNTDCLKNLITRIEEAHANRGVSREQMLMMTDAMTTHFLEILQPIYSPNVAVALEKLGKIIQHRFKF